MNIVKRPLMGAGVGTILALMCCGSSAAAEAPEIVLETSGVESPVSGFRDLAPIVDPNTWIKFDFGFATIEELLNGSFLDSATLTLQGESPAQTTIIATIDRSGTVWTPTVPGGLTLAPGSVQWTEIEFPELSPDLPHRKAYSAVVEIPAELRGQNLRFIIDLFDNKNGLDSVGYVSAPTVVPEPATMTLALGGLVFLFGFKWRNK